MKMFKFAKSTIVAAVAFITIAGLNVAPAKADGHLMVEGAWARAATSKVGGAFATIQNHGKIDDRLLSAASPVAQRVEIHTTEMKDGVMKMIEQKDGIVIPAGQAVELKPGGYHVMLMGLKGPLVEGNVVPVTLKFEKAGEVTLEVHIKAAGAMGGMKHDHSKMKKHMHKTTD